MSYTYKKYLQDKEKREENTGHLTYKEYSELKKKGQIRYSEDIANNWFDSVGKTSKDITDKSQNMNYDWAKNSFSDFDSHINDLNAQKNYVKRYIDSLKDIDEEKYNAFSLFFEAGANALNSSSDYIKNINNFASQYENETEFNQGWKNLQLSQKYKGLKTYDDFRGAMAELSKIGTDEVYDEYKWLETRAGELKTSEQLYADYNEAVQNQNKPIDREGYSANSDYEKLLLNTAVEWSKKTGLSTFDMMEHPLVKKEVQDKLKNKADNKLQEENLDKYFYNLDDDTKKILEDYNYNYGAVGLSAEENQKIKDDYLALQNERDDFEQLNKWYKRGKEDEEARENLTNAVEWAGAHPVLASGETIATAIPGAIQTAGSVIMANLDKLYGGDGYYNRDASIMAKNKTMQSTVSNGIDNDIGRFLYDTSMSMANSASALAIGAITHSPGLSLAIMGTEAGASSADDVLERGGSIGQALATGIASGIAETVAEKIPLEQLKD